MELTPANAALYRDWQRARKGAGHAELPRNAQALARLQDHHRGATLTGLSRADVLDWLAAMDDVAPATRRTYFSSARAFYNWCASEEERIIERSPMHGMKEPKAPDRPVPIPAPDDVRALIGAAERDRTPMGRRDAALIRIMCDTGGPRASEAAGILIAGRPGVPPGHGLDLARDHVTLTGKGGLVRTWPVAAKTAAAASRWIRDRDRLRLADKHPRLWHTFRSQQLPLTRSGVADIIERRCEQAGIPRLHPHQLRHFAYHHFLLAGGRENDAMVLFGWSDDQMPRHYARALAADRALQAGNALAIGDQW